MARSGVPLRLLIFGLWTCLKYTEAWLNIDIKEVS